MCCYNNIESITKGIDMHQINILINNKIYLLVSPGGLISKWPMVISRHVDVN